jgi:hypothetical protein
MRYMIWLLRTVLFFVLLGFAIKNDQPVVLHYFFGYEWQTSLILILFLFFCHGRRRWYSRSAEQYFSATQGNCHPKTRATSKKQTCQC